MGYPEDLLTTANTLLSIQPVKRAHLRRAVSTAYYAIFHLLIESACALWPHHRHRLARQFDHKRMKDASTAAIRSSSTVPSLEQAGVMLVANVFVQLQGARHEADYDLRSNLSFEQAHFLLLRSEDAVTKWNQIKATNVAQDYLFALLFKDRG